VTKMEIMNAFSACIAAAESATLEPIIDYATARKYKKITIKHRITDSLEDALISSTLAGKRSLAIGYIHSVKELCLKRLPAVLVSTAKKPVNHAINIFPETIQELYDDIICSFKLSEDKKILLPIVIHLDRLLKESREQFEPMTQKITENFLGPYIIDKPEKHLKLTLEENLESLAILEKAIENSKKIIPDVSDQWKKRTKRSFLESESFMTENTDFLFITYGSTTTNTRIAVQKLKELGEKVGMIKIHILNPFPLINVTNKKLAVIDTKILINAGLMYRDIKIMNQNTTSIIADIASSDDLVKAFQYMKTSDKQERLWLY
ncbi:MAG: hypothetical protein V1870_05235, partial [Candidatus Aenigmatarchaeota archaeon]